MFLVPRKSLQNREFHEIEVRKVEFRLVLYTFFYLTTTTPLVDRITLNKLEVTRTLEKSPTPVLRHGPTGPGCPGPRPQWKSRSRFNLK
ncbi:hypothetical protein TNCV_1892961 [Trichonephila clavipes]|nr:hypothetical protein TNCV_1892961 [Trichonephila clavipes]